MSLIPSRTGSYPPGQERILSLDVLRGLAIFGILFISIWEFGGFTPALQNYYRFGTHGGNHKLMTIVSIFFEGKMRALVALVFGAGIVLFMQRREYPATLGMTDVFIRRQMWLMAFGVFNAFILLWPGDLLFQLGIMGILVFTFWRMSPRGLIIGAMFCMLAYCGKLYWNYSDDRKDFKKYNAVMLIEKKFKADSLTRARKDSLDRKGDTIKLKDVLRKNKVLDSIAAKHDTLTTKQAGEKGKWEGLLKSFKYDSAAAKADRLKMRGDWGEIWTYLNKRSQGKESFWLYRIGIWDLSSMLFLGMALLGLGFFHQRFSAVKYLLIAVLMIIMGLLLAWWRIRTQDVAVSDYAKYVAQKSIPYNLFFPVERLLLATGYASGVLWLLRLKPGHWCSNALSAVGRLALTNYIIQTIICTFFFYGFGFAYYGRLTQWQLYFIVFEVILVQTVFSIIWLRYYTMGPLEWIWRCLVYRRWLPIKIQKPVSGYVD